MSLRSRVRRAHREEPELNITAFMNLMVVLVPFLLISAVFSHLAILQLNLPPDSSAQQQQQQQQQVNFEVIVRQEGLTVADSVGGVIRKFGMKNGGYDYQGLSEVLKTLKARFPARENITLLLEPDIPYDVLVQTMDTVRVVSVVESAAVVKKELFPQIAIGDAP